MRFEAAIFDCDGALVDSETPENAETLAAAGAQVFQDMNQISALCSAVEERRMHCWELSKK